MKRVMIIGCCGAGKSTLARRLHEKTNLPLIHLDQHFHLPNWTEPSATEWRDKVTELVKSDQWIMDGNYGGTMDVRLAKADTIVYLNFPTIRCLSRVIMRILKYHGQVRPDMPEGCPERFNLEFLHYVATYNMTRGAGILKRMNGFNGKKIILKNDKEVASFLEDVSMN